MAGLSEFEPLESRLLFATTAVAPDLTVLGDFNGDQKADEAIIHRDLAARNFSVLVALGRGAGTFLPSASVQIPNFTPTAAAIGDVNGDGNADLVLTGAVATAGGPVPVASSAIVASTNEVMVLLGNDKGGFLPAPSSTAATGAVIQKIYPLPRLLSTTSIAVGDFDGDGFTDIAVLGRTNPVAATGTTAITTSATAIDMLWDVAKPAALPQPMTLNTVDPPSLPGLAPVQFMLSPVIIALPPTLPNPITLSPVSTDTVIVLPANPNVNTLFAGDLDSDGRTDLVAALSSQTALPPSPILTPTPTPTIPIRPDLVTVRFPTDHTPVVTIGVNPLDIALPVPAANTSFALEQTLGLATLTPTGPLDLVGLRGDSIVYAAYDPSSQTFSPLQVARSVNTPPALASDTVYLADIDGDGLPDLLAQTPNGPYLGRNIPSVAIGPASFLWSRVLLVPAPIVTMIGL